MPEPQETVSRAGSGAAGSPARGFEIRRLTRLDPDLLTALAAHGRAALGDSALDEWMLPVIAAHGFLFAAMIDGEIIGAAEVIVSVRHHDLYLEGLYISPRYQGRGYGSRLLAGCIDALREHDFHRLLATVAPDNDAALGLYRSAGFSQTDYFSDYYGAGRHRLLLALPLKKETK